MLYDFFHSQLFFQILSDFLQIFEEATKEIEASKRPTLHLVIPWYFRLLQHCESSSLDCGMISNLKRAGLAYLTSNVSEHITIHHKVATFLCPKLKSLRMYNSSSIKNEIIDSAREMVETISPNETRETNSSSAATSARLGNHSSTTSRTSQAMLMFDDSVGVLDDEEDDVQRYINHHVRDMEEGRLLEWWVADSDSCSIWYFS